MPNPYKDPEYCGSSYSEEPYGYDSDGFANMYGDNSEGGSSSVNDDDIYNGEGSEAERESYAEEESAGEQGIEDGGRSDSEQESDDGYRPGLDEETSDEEEERPRKSINEENGRNGDEDDEGGEGERANNDEQASGSGSNSVEEGDRNYYIIKTIKPWLYYRDETSDEEDVDRFGKEQEEARINPYDIDDHESDEDSSKSSDPVHESIYKDFLNLLHEVKEVKDCKGKTWIPGRHKPSTRQTDEVQTQSFSPTSNLIIRFQGTVHPKQKIVADCLLEKIRRSQPDLFKKGTRIKYFDFFTIVPKFKSLGRIHIR